MSHPGSGTIREPNDPEHGAVLIRQLEGVPDDVVEWTGQENRYHKLDAFYQGPDNQLVTWDQFQEKLGKEADSRLLAESPWKASPPPTRQTLDRRSLLDLFQLKADVRLTNGQLAGIDQAPWRRSYNQVAAAATPERPPAIPPGRRIVDPEMKEESGNGRYRSLQEAILAAKKDDVILIHHKGRLPLRPTRLENPDFDIVIRPDKDCHPILTIDEKAPADKDAVLFRVHNGKLRLEQLEFLLQPGRDGFTGQTVASMVGDGQITFQDCLTTLDRSNRAVPLTVVRLDETDGVMKPAGAAEQRPGIHFENCFVRGEGDLLSVRGSRGFELGAENSAFALTGSVLNVENGPDAPAGPVEAPARLEMNHVSARLGGHLVRLLAGKELRGQVPIQADTVADCLFVSGNGYSLIHFDGPEVAEDKMKSLFPWKGRHNSYSNFSQMLDQQPSEPGAMTMLLFGQKEWKNQYEQDAQFDKQTPPPAPESFVRATLEQLFKPRGDGEALMYGADGSTLPKPEESR